ncbi:MAG: DUF3256 family protein [Porphyromonas sp.]|nr:DUF3256 family protein [Porphyromonas sp.]
MNRRATIILVGILFLYSAQLSAQKGLSVRKAFLEAPEYVFPLLNSNTKQSMVSNYEGTRGEGEVGKPTMNLLGGQCEIEVMSHSYLRFKLDADTNVELKLLKRSTSGHYISMIVTSMVTPRQSVVKFYGADWLEVNLNGIIDLPETQDFFVDPENVEQRDVKRALTTSGALSYEAHYAEELPILSIRVTSFDEPILQLQFPTVPNLLKEDGISYLWDGKRFKTLSN